MSAPAGAPERAGWPHWCLVVLLIALGGALRLRYLDEGALFIDEGESSINALTILERGYPADRYLGLPLFENTLTEPWPEHPEYEFRDTSYSSRGMAIYHGWLPLYAIALSLRLHGIAPDEPEAIPRFRHAPTDVQERIRAARLPSVAFGLLFLLAIHLAGTAMYGPAAGIAALTLAAFAPKCIWIAQQARYYSASLALSTLGLWSMWRLLERPRRRDWALAGLVFGLLFHTSSLAFAILCLAGLVLAPRILRQPGARGGLALATGILAALLLPWMAWSGYLQHAGRIPMARELLGFEDYFLYLKQRDGRTAAGVVGLLAFVLLWLRRDRLPERVRCALVPLGRPALLLSAWIVAAYFGFQVLVPSASCSLARMTHNLIAGPILLCALALGFLGRVLVPRWSVPFALAASFTLLIGTGNFLQWQRRNPYEIEAVRQTLAALRAHAFRADTRIYSLPYQHFCLMYYTGLPVQSIAPVRREFLERYPGEILVLETTNRVPSPDWRSIQEEAARHGRALAEFEARTWAGKIMALMIRAEVAPLVRRFEPDPGPTPDWALEVARTLLKSPPARGRFDYYLDNPAMFKGVSPLYLDEFWPAFFYRFVDPAQRSGANVNYAGRLAEAEARLLPASWLVLRIPAREEPVR